jgi:nickel superoxide dismutase
MRDDAPRSPWAHWWCDPPGGAGRPPESPRLAGFTTSAACAAREAASFAALRACATSATSAVSLRRARSRLERVHTIVVEDTRATGSDAVAWQNRRIMSRHHAATRRDACLHNKRRCPMDLSRLIAPRRVAHAHCDIPCGVYDPAQARIEAESCYRIIEKYHASDDALFRARCIHVKEERAELTKHHIDVMWHDYFKPEHLERYPDLHDVCWKASKQASAVKRTLDIAEAQKLLELIDRIDEMWKGTGGPAATRLPA